MRTSLLHRFSTGLAALTLTLIPATQAYASGPGGPGVGAAVTSNNWVVPHPAVADTGTLVLSGQGSVRVPADRVRIQLAVETQAASAAEAADLNAGQTTAVISALRPLLGDEDRMETSGYQLAPIHAPRDRDDPGPRIVGYQATNMVTVVAVDVGLAGPILDGAITAGANRVAELSFFTADLSAARDQALREAIAQAQHQAELISEALGVPLGEILEVRTNGFSEPSFRRGGAQFEMAMADATPIESGSQVVTANVSITWSLPNS